MATIFGKVLAGAIDRMVRAVVIPITSVIPFLVSSGILLVAFGAMWAGFGAAMLANPAALDDVWASIARLPLPVQGLGWLLAMPLMAGLWVHDTDWPLIVRVVLIAAIAGWNLLVFLPRRDQAGAAPAVQA